MIIDFHAHCFPDKIAEKAIAVLAKNAGTPYHVYDGTARGLIETLRRENADKAVVLNIATNAHQQASVNDFAISLLQYPQLIPFGSVYPDSKSWSEELDRLAAAGIKGIKFHPEYQSFFVDEKRMLPIYEKIGSLGMITTFHSGFDLGYLKPFRCTPQRLKNILPAFGGAPVVAAHMGGISELYDTLELLCDEDIYLDTAYVSGTTAPKMARAIIDALGVDRVLMGSDLPWVSIKNTVGFIDCLDLSEVDRAKLLGGNACRLLGL